MTSYAFATRITNAANQSAYTQFSYYLGKPVNAEDPNGVVTAGYYNDPLDRPTQVIRGTQPASPLISQATFAYNDAARTITTTSDQNITGDNRLISQMVYDGLGRTIETHNSAPEGMIISKQTYDAMGRVARSYNPYRSTTEDTYGWTDTSYDGLGRAIKVETFDRFAASTGAVLTSYFGNQVTATDQAGKVRRSLTDGLGRLMTVVEDPAGLNFTTSYSYDALDDLVRVTQGSQSRFFMYDSLKRLIRAKNVEQDMNAGLNLFDAVTGNSQWCMAYTYDENSNLKTKTDSRSPAVTSTYFYDVLNRVTKRTYTDATPEVNYFYDNQSLPAGFPATFSRGASVGRLVATLYGGATSSTGSYQGFDAFGRVTQSYQKTDTQSYGFIYGYDLVGEMTSEQYPSGRVITTGYDSAGRITGLSGQQSTVTTVYGSQMSYTAAGAMTAMAIGNGKWEHTLYNSRLQPKEIGLGVTSGDSGLLKLEYGYGTTTNNGNVLSQRMTVPKTAGGSLALTESYSYDALNRLGSVSEDGVPSFSEHFSFDRYGNMWVSASSGITLNGQTPRGQSSFDQNTNRFNAAVLTNVLYDGAGNLIKDIAGNQFTYDGENRQLTSNAGVVIASYSYDGDGQRIKKIVGTTTIVMVYNVAGQMIAEYTSDPLPPPAGGGGTSYLTSDHLGSTRMVTKADGSVKVRYDYLPFGEEIASGIGGRSGVNEYTGGDSTRQKFTAKERDSESGLDYFLARYHSSAQGRFASVDPYNVVTETQNTHNKKEAQKQFRTYLGNPQRWNRYPYALNNPLFYTDPNGEDVTIYYRPPNENSGSTQDQGHIFIYVRNDETGESAYLDYYPDSETGSTVIGNMTQERVAQHSSLTVETTPEQEQAILDRVKEIMKSAPDANYNLTNLILSGGTTCVSNCRDALNQGGINISSIAPRGVWMEAFGQYASKENNPLGWHPESSYGFPTPKGALSPEFDWCREFSEGLALISIDSKYGYIDKTGKYIWQPVN